ncbi:uncharacterized protein LOC117180638 [Belonocnema kinseyi]|uniref:uncharacterized protein LOC117180638 n=1 Tax=Belonocnema kinseyi TaxID=2817044 RepID=UPI00143E0E52|nr:uncharacterized protein LOC117180638 [Belonocnema kinseyi]
MISRCLLFSAFLALAFATQEYLRPLKGMQGLLITCDNEEKLGLVLQYKANRNFEFLSISDLRSENVQVLVTANEVSDFKKLLELHEIKYKVYIDDFQKLVDEESKAQKLAHKRSRRSFGVNAPYHFNHFPRLKTINRYLIETSKKYDDVTLFSIGSSFEGRQMYGVKISSGENETKPAILIDAGIHAREWIAPTTALFAISRLVKNESRHIYENLDWYIIPQINPDGYEYSRTKDRMWRKTRSHTTNPGCRGVDANRNFGYKWMFYEPNIYTRVSPNPCENIYAGEKAFSEMETQNLRDFFLSKNGTIKAYVSLHSTSQNTKSILAPWAYTKKLLTNSSAHINLAEKAARAASSVRGTNYTTGFASHIYYAAPGASMDWAIGVGGANLSYTIELPSHNFMTSPENISVIGLEIFRALKIFAKYVVSPASLAATQVTAAPGDEIVLKEDVLKAIGPCIISEKILSEPIRELDVSCWSDILKQGLPKEDFDKLVAKYSPPSNCSDIEPSILNPAIKDLLIKINLESVIRKDGRISKKQLKLKASLAAVGKGLNELLKALDVNVPLVESFGDVGRLLADLHHDESNIRNSLISSNLNINGYMLVMSQANEDVTIFSIGQSFVGREMYGVKISSGVKYCEKLAILIEAGIHAREWISPVRALFTIFELVKENNKYLYENIDWYIIPSMNPNRKIHSDFSLFSWLSSLFAVMNAQSRACADLSLSQISLTGRGFTWVCGNVPILSALKFVGRVSETMPVKVSEISLSYCVIKAKAARIFLSTSCAVTGADADSVVVGVRELCCLQHLENAPFSSLPFFYAKLDYFYRKLLNFFILRKHLNNITNFLQYHLWRKTMSNSTNSECFGTDGNRNFYSMWMNGGASSDPCSEAFAGSKPFSEIESRNLHDFILSLKGTIKIFISLHSNGQLLGFPWGYTKEFHVNYTLLKSLGDKAARVLSAFRGTTHVVDSIARMLYEASGESIDWAMTHGGADLSYVFELPGYYFQIHPQEIKPVGLEIFEAFKVFGKYLEEAYIN